MNKQQLASKIWAGANELRGKVSASSYKDYMLGLIFYKYLSEKEETYLLNKLYFEKEELVQVNEEDSDTVENCQKNIGYFIEYKNLFSFWKMESKKKQELFKNEDTSFSIANVRKALSAFTRLIGENYHKVYDGIFDTLEKGLDDLGTTDADRTKAVGKLTDLINEIPTDGSQDYDVLGFVYEFLLKNFAANAGKAGEFYTPYEASTVMSEIIAHHLKNRTEISIYDPTSGSGSLLINIGKSVSKQMNDPNKVKYYAQELIENTYNLTRMNLIMRDILPDNIIVRNGDTLGDDWPFFEEGDKEHRMQTYDPAFVDACSSNPPYSQSWVTDDADSDVRFKDYGVAPKSKADYAFLLHNLYHLKPDGIMTIVLPHGVLFRGGEEGKIRQKLIENNNIETIIGLPANIFFGTGIPTLIMVLKKNRENDDVLFIDASKGFIKDGNKNRLQAKDVRRIVDTVIERNPSEKDKKYARLVSKAEIEKNEYNLNIPRYVDSSDKAEIWDIYSTMFGGIPNYEIDELDAYWKALPSLRKDIFTEQTIPYSVISHENLREAIDGNTDVKAFIDASKLVFGQYSPYLKGELIDNLSTVVIAKEETILAQKLRELLKNNPLIDYYDAYQVLANNWTQIALDLEILKQEGLESIKKVDTKYIVKKNSKTKETYEAPDGLIGRILSFERIQDKYFSEDKKEVERLATELASLESTKAELLESIDHNDKEQLVDDEGDIVSKKLNAEINKIKKQLKNGAEFEEDSYEDILLKINECAEKIKKCKAKKKELLTKLEAETKEKIEGQTDTEAIANLEDKWITPIYEELCALASDAIDELERSIIYLQEKYSTTYEEVSSKIEASKKTISSLIEELEGNEFDKKGLKEFNRIIGGQNNESN